MEIDSSVKLIDDIYSPDFRNKILWMFRICKPCCLLKVYVSFDKSNLCMKGILGVKSK